MNKEKCEEKKVRKEEGVTFCGDSVAYIASFREFRVHRNMNGSQKRSPTFAPFKTGGCAKSLALLKPRPTGVRNTRVFAGYTSNVMSRLLSLLQVRFRQMGNFTIFNSFWGLLSALSLKLLQITEFASFFTPGSQFHNFLFFLKIQE